MSDNFDIDALLDGTLDDLADIPEFKLFPPGCHLCTVTSEAKKMGKVSKPNGYEFTFTGIETVELPAGSTDEPISKGQVAKVGAILAHEKEIVQEFGQGLLKMICAAAAAKFGQKSNRELLADLQNAEVRIVTGVRKGKDANGNETKNVQLLAIEVV